MLTETSLTQGTYERIKADLLAGRYRPGDRLKIADICNKLGVSLGAVREALSRLSSDGMVLLEPQKGFSVSPISESELHDLMMVRSEIERQCLRRAIAVGDVRWESQIVATFHEWSRALETNAKESSDAVSQAHAAFHRALVAACDSPWLLKLREILFTQSERYRRLSMPLGGFKRDIEREHRDIMNAALKRDTDRATALLSAHFAATVRVLVDSKVVTPAGTKRRRRKA